MSKENFFPSIMKLLEHEGGYSNDPHDPGGPTNYGITIIDYRLYIKKDGTAEDVKKLTKDQAVEIYRKKYWDAMKCDELPSGVDYAVFDYGVNSGIGRGGKVLRRFIGLPTTTSKITDEVIEAAKKKNAEQLIIDIMDERLAFLKALRTWQYFGRGWGRRVTEVRQLALNLAKGIK